MSKNKSPIPVCGKSVRCWIEKIPVATHSFKIARRLKNIVRSGFVRKYSRYKTRVNVNRNAGKTDRKLEIGPGPDRIPGFETLNIVPGFNVDYVCDAGKRLPFADNEFCLVYASHILEHIPWYQSLDVLREWVRILRPGGKLEVWVPDGLKICQAFVDAEINNNNYIEKDGWYRFNSEKEICKWAAGRIFTYGDGGDDLAHPNWHHAIFSERYLKKILKEAGLIDIHKLQNQEVRGHDHGWINLGVVGQKE